MLVALFVIASGITILQVVANPLAAALGPPERSHFRLTFSQAFNSFGTLLAPMLVSGVILAGGIFAVTHGAEVTPELRAESFRNIDSVFLAIAGALVLLAVFIYVFRKLLDVTKPVDEGQRAFDRRRRSSRAGRCSAPPRSSCTSAPKCRSAAP